MKKMIAVALLLVGMTGFAQEKNLKEESRLHRAEMEKLSPEQRNQLQLKKLTLELDLSASQQKEMAKIIAEQENKREAMKAEIATKKEGSKKPTADELFVMKNKNLDDKIAMKEKVKKILTPEQLEKWEKMKKEKRSNLKRGTKKLEKNRLEQK